MKSSTQVFASLVAALATLSQSAIATPSSRAISQNAIDSYQLTGNKITLPSKIELQPLSLVAQQSDICKPGTIPVRINAPDNATPAYSGKLQPGVNSGTRCIFFKDVSLSVRANGKSKTWLIIHGWLNNSDTKEIKDLALEVARQNPGDRVLMLDWGEAARNGGNTQVPKVGDVGSLGVYYAASWIRPIAEAVVDKLKSDYGLTEQEASQNLNIVGHSLGTLMAGEIGAVYSGMNPKGEKEKGGSPINTIIALDPASETSTALNLGGYDVDGRTPAYTFKGKNFLGASQRDPHPEAIDRPKHFDKVSRFSRAFVGAKSLAGNQEFASWAHESFQMDFGNITDNKDNLEHERVVKAFTNLISQHPFKQANSKNNFLDLNDMRVHNDCEDKGSSYFMKCNTVDGKHEGTVEVNSSNLPTLVKFTTSSGEKQQIAATQPKPIATKLGNRSKIEQSFSIEFSTSRNSATLRQDLFKWEQGVSQNSYAIRNNILKIIAAPGTDSFPNTEPRIIYPISGDFEAIVKVKFSSNTNYQRATLGVRDIHSGSGLMRLYILEGQRIEAAFYPENNTDGPDNIRNYPYNVAYLKIKRQNGFLTGSYSTDRKNWSFVMKRKMAINFPNIEIFLSVLSTDSTKGCAAEFSEFNIHKI